MGGTLLLDEESEKSVELQAKMLRDIQEREGERLGGRRPVALDVRLIATTNRQLQREVEEGRFREDLFYRLSVFPLQWPPCVSAPRTSCPWPSACWPTTPAAWGGYRQPWSPRPESGCWPTTGPAMCGSWTM